MWFGENHRHAVTNRTDTGATSLHVYSPPLGSMNFYEADQSGDDRPARLDNGSGWLR